MTHPVVIENRFLERSARLRTWGTPLLVIAGLLWVFAAFELFTPWDSTYGKYSCSAPAFGDRGALYTDPVTDGETHDHDVATSCARDRDWPQPLAALALSLPLGVVGASLTTAAAVATRLRRLENDLSRATK